MSKDFLKKIMYCFLVAGLVTLAVRSCASPEATSDSIPVATVLDCIKSLPKVAVRDDENITSKDVEAEGDKLEGLSALNKYSEAYLMYMSELGYAIGREARGDVSASVELNRSVEKPEFPFKVGRAFAKAGKHKIAIECFTESLTQKINPPNDASAYLNRGESYLATGQKEKARGDYQMAVTLFQKHGLPQYEKMTADKLRVVNP